jgi:hypothetical protein
VTRSAPSWIATGRSAHEQESRSTDQPGCRPPPTAGGRGDAGRPARLPLDLKQRLTPWRAECGENRGGEQELQACRERTRAVPAVLVEEFPSTRAQERKDVLEIRRGARCSAKCGRIEQASPQREEEDARQAAADLEPTRVKVSVRNAVARDVKNRPQKECCEPRAAGGAGRSACGHVEGNYHGCLTSLRLDDTSGTPGACSQAKAVAARKDRYGIDEHCRRCLTVLGSTLVDRAASRCALDNRNPPFPAGFEVELAGLEPATSWVRSRRSPN